MSNKFKISVVIPAFNNGRYISRSIDSVLAQTRSVDEIIVVDDGSTDNTADAVKHYGEKIRYIYQDNAGASAARNTGIQAAAGDWIAFLDGDDEWLPHKIELQTELLARNPDLVWTTGNYIECLCDENRRAEQATQQQCKAYLKGKDFFDSYFRAIQLYQWGCTDCKLIRKDVLVEAGLFCTDLPKANDIDMWLRIAYQYPAIGFSCEPLAVYHLSVADSIVKKYRTNAVHADFIQRHLAFAQQKGALEQFEPAAAFMMRRWIRAMLFEGRKAEIRELLKRFPKIFSPVYCGLIFALTVFPDLTASCLRLLSRIIRRLKLRRRVTRRPPRGAC
jgi:glycosyltransferase involved in cell wall biosynthesis